MKHIFRITMLLVLVLCLLSGCGGQKEPEPTPAPPTPTPTAEPTPSPTPEPIAFETVVSQNAAGYSQAADTAALYEALTEAWTAADERIEYGGDAPLTQVPEDGAVTLYAGTAAEYPSGDTVVTDGTYLYMLTGTTLRILAADGVNTAQLTALEVGSAWSDTRTDGASTWGGFEKYPSALFLSGAKLAVLSDWYGYEAYMQGGESVCDYTEYTCVDIYDVTDPLAPVLTASFGQDGCESAAQVQDGLLYLATSHWVYSDADPSDPGSFMPRLYTAQGQEVLPVSAVSVAAQPGDSVYAVVCVYDLENASRTDAKALLGANGGVVMSGTSVYALSERYATALSLCYEESVYTVSDYASAACTDIYRFELSAEELSLMNAGSVTGHLAGERSAAVLGGTLRLATREENFRYTIYADAEKGFENILWGTMETGGRVSMLSADLVTVTDAEPTNVFDGYLYNWTDGVFVGLSRDDTSAAKLGIYTRGTDGALQETAARTFGSDYSKTLSSAGAICVDPAAGIIGFAADDGYSFHGYTPEEGLAPRLDAYLTDWPWHVRCVVVGDCLYLTDMAEVYVYSLADLALLHTLAL